MEVEYTCGDAGPTPYDFDPEFVDIRVKLILFGVGAMDDADTAHFEEAMRSNLQVGLRVWAMR
eukprot:342653-Rhodomonas_salina.2